MSDPLPIHLSRRERQIMDVIYQKGRATAAEVMESLPDPPGYSAVRAMLKLLTEKGHLEYEQQGLRYVYMPTVAREKASQWALRHLVQTFFDGSVEQAVSTLLDISRSELSDEDLERLSRMVAQASGEGR